MENKLLTFNYFYHFIFISCFYFKISLKANFQTSNNSNAVFFMHEIFKKKMFDGYDLHYRRNIAGQMV